MAIAKVLEEKNTTLQVLTLSRNNLGPEGAAVIANVLIVNQTLQDLNLEHDDIGPQGAVAIC